jgi:hypothetical protein
MGQQKKGSDKLSFEVAGSGREGPTTPVTAIKNRNLGVRRTKYSQKFCFVATQNRQNEGNLIFHLSHRKVAESIHHSLDSLSEPR